MTYAVFDDMIQAFGADELTQLTDRADPPAGVPDQTIIESAINDAEAEINAYLANRYALPLATVPGNLKRMTCDVARYYLFGPALTDEVEKRYRSTIAFLTNVSKGVAALGVDETTGNAPTVDNSPEHFGSPRIFSQERLKDYSG